MRFVGKEELWTVRCTHTVWWLVCPCAISLCPPGSRGRNSSVPDGGARGERSQEGRVRLRPQPQRPAAQGTIFIEHALANHVVWPTVALELSCLVFSRSVHTVTILSLLSMSFRVDGHARLERPATDSCKGTSLLNM